VPTTNTSIAKADIAESRNWRGFRRKADAYPERHPSLQPFAFTFATRCGNAKIVGMAFIGELRTMRRWWMRLNGGVLRRRRGFASVTFNYDTMLEEAMRHVLRLGVAT